MKNKIKLALRLVLGLIFFVFGLNAFLNFLPPQPPMPEQAGELIGAFVKSGYLMTFIKGTEIVVGSLLLSGFFAPLALVILAPISINILLFHTILAPAGAGMAIAIVIMQLVLAWFYRDSYRELLKAK